MNFRYIITQNNREIAGFHDFLNACNYKDMIQSINRTAGYKDRFQITDTQTEKTLDKLSSYGIIRKTL